MNDGDFHHIAATREADGTGRIYIDGVLDGSQSGVPSRALIPLEVFVGADKRDNDRFFKGLIDEVEIYDRALTQPEIQDIFNARSAGKLKALVHALWVFPDTGVPNEVTDSILRQDLINRSSSSGVNALYLSLFQSSPNGAGRLMYEDGDVAVLITDAHAQGIEVWAAYGAPDWPIIGCDGTRFPPAAHAGNHRLQRRQSASTGVGRN